PWEACLRSLGAAGGGRGRGRGTRTSPSSCGPLARLRRWQAVGYTGAYKQPARVGAAGAAEGAAMEDLNSTQEQTEATSTPKAARKSAQKAKGKTEKKKKEKAEKAGAWKKDPKKIAQLKKDIPLGSLVRYTGTRSEGHEVK